MYTEYYGVKIPAMIFLICYNTFGQAFIALICWNFKSILRALYTILMRLELVDLKLQHCYLDLIEMVAAVIFIFNYSIPRSDNKIKSKLFSLCH